MEYQLSARDVAVVGVRLFGLYELMRAFGAAVQALTLAMSRDPNAGFSAESGLAAIATASVVYAVVSGVIGLLCFWKPLAVVRRLFPEYREGFMTGPLAAFGRTAISIVGVALAAFSAPGAVMLLIAVLKQPDWSSVASELTFPGLGWSSYLQSLVGLGVGIIVLASAKWLAQRA